MHHTPTQLEMVDDSCLQITWDDGGVLRYPVSRLREVCPCATCREQRRGDKPAELLPVLSLEETQPVRIAAMSPIGNYAYGIEFSDGHDTGIFTLELLREIGQPSREA